MAKTVGFKIEILGTDEISKELIKLEGRLRELTEQRKQLTKESKQGLGKERLEELDKELADTNIALKQTRQQQNELRKSFLEGSKTIKAASGSYNELVQRNRALKAELRQLPDAFDKNNTKVRELQAAIKNNTNQLKSFDKAMGDNYRNVGNYSSALSGLKSVLGAAGVAGGLTLAVNAIKDAVRSSAEFEKSLDNLSAITGAVGQDLEFYRQQALAVAQDQQLATVSASEFTESLKLIGSARPELLQNKEALVALTKEAIILSQASGDDLVTSATNLGDALNFMRLPAEEAGRVMNVLAAASQKGTREIPYVNEALSKFGGIAASAGISIETSAAAIETLGEVIPEASTAGNNLRNIITILQVEADKAGRPFQGLQKELEIWGADVDNVTKLSKVFGRENLLAAQTLIAQRDSLAELEKSITGTNTAYEQARTNTDNLTSNYERLINTIGSLVLNEGQGFNDLLNEIVKVSIDFVKVLAELPDFLNENKEELILLGSSIIALNAQQILATTTTKGLTLATQAQALAQRLLNTVLKANPIGLIITGVTLLATGFVALYKRSETFRNSVDALIKPIKEFANTILNGLEPALKFLGFESKKVSDTNIELKDTTTELTDNIKKEDEAIKTTTKAYTDNITTKKQAKTATEKLNDELGKLKKALDDQALSGNLNNETLDKYILLSNQAKEAQDKLKESIEAKTDAAKIDIIKPEDLAIELPKEIPLPEIGNIESPLKSLFGLNPELEKQIIDGALNLSNQLGSIIADNRRAQIERQTDEQLRELDAQKERELSNKKLTDQQKLAIEEKYAKEKDAITREEAKKEQNISAIQAIINGLVAGTKALATPPAPNLLLARLAVGKGIADAAVIKAQKFALGGDFVTSGPKLIMVGDNPGGRERVQVTPLSSPNINGPNNDISKEVSTAVINAIKVIPVQISQGEIDASAKKVEIINREIGFN